MPLPKRLSLLFFIGFFAAGSTALGYYYYYVYEPPIAAAMQFMKDMESGNADAVRNDVVVSGDWPSGSASASQPESLRPPDDRDMHQLMAEHFERGRILDQHTREGRSRNYYYLVYREPDGRVFAMVVTLVDGHYRVVVPQAQLSSKRHRYLWDYTWTN